MAQRILILGSTGSGKTTLAQKLAKELGSAHIELDALYWDPGWKAKERDTFRAAVFEEIQKESWVLDGNYTSKVADLVWNRADLVIWLDYPLWRILYQLFKRTARRSWTKEELWPGCSESFWLQLFTKQSIFVWAFKTHFRKQKRFPLLFAKHPHLTVIRVSHPRDIPSLEEIKRDYN